MLRLTGTRAYELPVWDENPGTKAKPTMARPQMHFESMTVQMVFDSSGLYRTWLGVYFSWWDFCYTALLGNWSEGSRFVLTLARSNERRYLEIRDGQVVEVLTGERLFINKGGQEWEYVRAAERLWSAVRLAQ
ncbi:MAG: hypothetical protein RBT75_09950 [Anaerolineae bacterium]|nr:hypothetical protein [Anaerolineae bacterium]